MGIVQTIRSLGSGALKWTGDNQLLAAMGLNAAAQAFTPSAYELEQRRLKRANENWDVSGIDLGMRPGGQDDSQPTNAMPGPGIVAQRRGIGYGS